ncbi:MAG: hypothetical protein CBC13_10500 [Planctomycetia bacterium TMED53]|nr:MAG: hypothetical protein CBC13_10500 [Planctomycetia bacterium TMED53]
MPKCTPPPNGLQSLSYDESEPWQRVRKPLLSTPVRVKFGSSPVILNANPQHLRSYGYGHLRILTEERSGNA